MTEKDKGLQDNMFLPINTWKAIAILMVLGIHTTGSYVLNYRSLKALHQVLVINVLVSGAVAMFVFASGYGLTKKHRNDNDFGWKEFVLLKLGKIVPGYVIWSLLYEVIQYMLYEKPLSLEIFLKDLLWGKAMYHLYYMVFFIQLMILFPGLLQLIKRSGYKLLIVAGFVQWMSFRYTPYPWSSILFTSYIFYFVWGMTVADMDMVRVEKGICTDTLLAPVYKKSAEKNNFLQNKKINFDGIGKNYNRSCLAFGLSTLLYLISCSIKFIEYESQYNTAKTPIRLLGHDITYFFQGVSTIFLAMQLVPMLDYFLKEKTAGFWWENIKNIIHLIGKTSPLIYYLHPMILIIGIELGGRYTVTAGGLKVVVLWILLASGSVLGALGIQWIQQGIARNLRGLRRG